MSVVLRLSAWFNDELDRLPARQRHIALGVVSLLAVLFVGVITWKLQGVIADRASRVILAKENLVAAQALAVEHQALAEKIAAAEARIGPFKPDSMNTYLETWATQTGVASNLKNIQPRESKTVGDFLERDFRVDVEQAELSSLLRFLHMIEVSDYPIKVRSAEFRVREFKRERVLDLSLDLETFSKEEGS
jgi:hypothetical protein